MSKTLKRCIAAIVSLSLVASVLCILPVHADDPVDPPAEPGRHLTIDYLGKGSAPGALPAKQTNGKLKSSDVSTLFWVGVSVDNVDDMNLFKSGVSSLEIAFEYDPKYIEPYFGVGDNKLDDFVAKIKEGNFAAANDSILSWDEALYDITADTVTRDIAIDTHSDREGKESLDDKSKWKMSTIGLYYKDDATGDMRFKNLSGSDKRLLLAVPFKFISAPAEDTNPAVLSFVLGPKTFDIGSGSTGENPHASWWATEKVDDPTNLKTYFTYDGDITLFGTSTAVEDIRAYNAVTKEGEEDPDEYDLYTTKELDSTPGFQSDIDEYWMSVPYETENIVLHIKSADKPAIKQDGTKDITPANKDGNYVTESITLKEIDPKNKGDTGGFENTITIEVSGLTYTLHIKRLLEPTIVLNYGNSPYAMIERMGVDFLGETDGWSEEKIATAKSEFNKKNRYVDGNVPTDCDTGIIYQPKAWTSDATEFDNEDINMDRNLYSLFIYQRKPFKDPGIKVTDAEGNVVDLTAENVTVTRTVKDVKRMKAANMQDLDASSGDVVLDLGVDNTISTLTSSSLKLIRPGIYDFVYKVEVDGEELGTVTRKLILLAIRGDINLDNDINSNDETIIREHYQEITNAIPTGLPQDVEDIYMYRILDVNMDTDINSNDETLVREHYQETEAIPLLNHYILLK